MHGQDDPVKSVFSSDFVIEISKRYLTHRYESHIDPQRSKHPASAQVVHLGLALANLNGVDYGLTTRPDGNFVYTRHQDELKVYADATDARDDALDFWDPIRNAAVSCGAFPSTAATLGTTRNSRTSINSAAPVPKVSCPIALPKTGESRRCPRLKRAGTKNSLCTIPSTKRANGRIFTMYSARGPTFGRLRPEFAASTGSGDRDGGS